MSPLIMKSQDNFRTGFLGILVCQAYNIVAAQVLFLLYRRRNNKRDAQYGEKVAGHAFTDETDLQNKNFRYVW
jgi:hypothetical protein